MHKLLQRQIRKTLGLREDLPRELAGFLALVDDAYIRNDEDRRLLERSLELTSQELLQANTELRRSSEKALKKSEAKYRSLFEESRDVIFITGADRRLTDINQAGVELFGFSSREDLLATDLGDTVYRRPQDRRRFLDRVIARGSVEDQELELKRLDGRELVVLVTASVIRGEDGKVRGIRGTVRDVTERRALEQRLQQSQKMEAVGRLAGGVAHDFNNLLTAIIGYTDLLDDRLSGHQAAPRSEAKAKSLAYLAQIRTASERGADLVRQLLAFSRQQVLNPKVISLNRVVSGIEKLLARVIGEDVRLITELDRELGSVLADPNQMEQVILNLAVNGREAMPGGGPLHLRTRRYEGGAGIRRGTSLEGKDCVVLEIEDAGVGIEDEHIDSIFEPFYTTKSGGTGLGLATVYGIVQQSGGQIRVDSRPGVGTTFTVVLPRHGAVPSADRAPADQVGPPPGSETILLVEDDAAVRDLLHGFLTAQGYRVQTADDGEQGLEVFARLEDELDLLLTDVVMPKMGGLELTEKIRAQLPDLRVLFISGYSESQESLLEQVGAGAGFLQKPFTPDELAHKLRDVLAPEPTPAAAPEPTPTA